MLPRERPADAHAHLHLRARARDEPNIAEETPTCADVERQGTAVIDAYHPVGRLLGEAFNLTRQVLRVTYW